MGCYYAMPATGGYGLSGTPDFLVCYQGAFAAIECKAGKNKPQGKAGKDNLQGKAGKTRERCKYDGKCRRINTEHWSRFRLGKYYVDLRASSPSTPSTR